MKNLFLIPLLLLLLVACKTDEEKTQVTPVTNNEIPEVEPKDTIIGIRVVAVSVSKSYYTECTDDSAKLTLKITGSMSDTTIQIAFSNSGGNHTRWFDKNNTDKLRMTFFAVKKGRMYIELIPNQKVCFKQFSISAIEQRFVTGEKNASVFTSSTCLPCDKDRVRIIVSRNGEYI